jgi:hypothetical protein
MVNTEFTPKDMQVIVDCLLGEGYLILAVKIYILMKDCSLAEATDACRENPKYILYKKIKGY